LIYILVAVHDRKEITRRFLAALERQTVRDFQVILVNDGSIDGTREMLTQEYPQVQILSGNGDLWWTGSMRLGVDWICERAAPGDFILCANNDQIPREDAVSSLLLTSRSLGNAIVGSVSRGMEDHEKIYDSAYSWNWKTNRYARVPVKDRGYISEGVDVLTCRFTIVPIEVFKRATFRSDLFPHYLGDHDFFMDAKNAGYPLVLSYDSVVYDVGGPSGNYQAGWKRSFRQLYDNFFSIRSHANLLYMTRYYFKHCPSVFFRVYFLVRLALKVLLQFFGAVATVFLRFFSRAEGRPDGA
jgi:GT2 family glycosyltransferase